MRHDASLGAQPFAVGDLVVISGRVGVWRVERFVDVEGRPHARCFSYVDGAIVVVDADALGVVPDNHPADRNVD
jgi:hypothetical protein